MLIRFIGNRKLDYNLSILSQFDNWPQNLCPDMDWASESINFSFFSAEYVQIHSDKFEKYGNKRKRMYTPPKQVMWTRNEKCMHYYIYTMRWDKDLAIYV